MQIFVQHGGQQLGPFTEAELKAQLASGAISLDDHVWWQGQGNWIPLSQSQFAPGAAPAIPGIPSVPAGSLPTTTPPSSNLAVWALVLGCLGFLCSIFASIPAIIVGHKSLSRIKKNPGMEGHGMALAGTILGYIFTVVGLIYIPIVAISVLIALGNQVKGTFNTINSQIEAAGATNSDSSSTDQNSSNSDSSSTNSDSSTNAPSTTSPDQSTNAAPASTDSSTNTDSSTKPSGDTNSMSQ